MSTRWGDIAPGLISYLMVLENWSDQELLDATNSRSERFGVSETNSDRRGIMALETPDVRAKAVQFFATKLKRG